eukprot:763989-Hanusia_phi.AAC.3
MTSSEVQDAVMKKGKKSSKDVKTEKKNKKKKQREKEEKGEEEEGEAREEKKGKEDVKKGGGQKWSIPSKQTSTKKNPPAFSRPSGLFAFVL